MGMAASQARFLGLTARKTNVEYEGQQVNQQRTALANQSANYYNDLLGMTVPTPPSVSDFTKTVYTFNDGNLSNSISSLIAQSNGQYLVSYVSKWTNDYTPVSAGNAVLTKNNDAYYFGSVKLRDLGIITLKNTYDNNDYQVRYNSGNWQCLYNGAWTNTNIDSYSLPQDDEYLKSLSFDQLAKLLTEEVQLESMLDEKYGTNTSTESWYVRYEQNTSTGTWSPVFYNKQDVQDASYSGTGTSQSNIPQYKMGSAEEVEEVRGVPARLEQDSTGRYINITLNPGDPNEVTYALNTNTVTDQQAYDDAMNQYEYDKNKYDQAIQEINTKIEIIQAQDKNLELRLKQLDTEQDAISQEMDAVTKVVEKNIEKTFNTFG